MNVPNAFICLDWTLLYCIVYCEIEKLFVTFTIFYRGGNISQKWDVSFQFVKKS